MSMCPVSGLDLPPGLQVRNAEEEGEDSLGEEPDGTPF